MQPETVTITVLPSTGAAVELAATRVGDDLFLTPEALATATGWTLKPEGLCRGAVCIPASLHGGLLTDDGLLDVVAVGRATDQPTVVDADAGVVAFGTSAASRGERLASLDAPPFTVDDLDGHPVSLDHFAGRKKLLVAFASWCG